MTNKKRSTLPDGCYKIKILDVMNCKNMSNNGHHLKIAYDIVSPEESKAFFNEDYYQQQSVNQKWNGFTYLSIPYQVGSLHPSVSEQRFKEFIDALRDSNPEYVYDRKLTTMHGLLLGAYIKNQPYKRDNGSECNIVTITKFCSLDEYELERCNYVLPFLAEDNKVIDDTDEFNLKGGGYEEFKCLSTLRIIIDTREKPGKKADHRYSQFCCPYMKSGLLVGDYCFNVNLPSGRELIEVGSKAITPKYVAIERKCCLDEAISIFVGNKKIQFKNEIQRAKDANCKLYLLIENSSWEEVISGKYRSKIEPDVLLSLFLSYQTQFDMPIVFCPESHSGKIIHDILYYELKKQIRSVNLDEELV